jgi:hypothetical protein
MSQRQFSKRKRIAQLVCANVVLVGAFFAGCRSEPGESIIRPLDPKELVGIYQPTTEAKEFLSREGIPFDERSLRLELRADGKFQLSEIPDCWRASGKCNGLTETVTGEWKIYQERSGLPNRLHLSVEDAGPQTIYSVPLRVAENRFILAFYFGDPDSGRVVFLQK